MAYLIYGLEGIIGIVSLVCLVMVVIKMFQSGDSTMGIICLVLLLVCGTGVLLTFVMGWVKSPQYGSKQIMKVWTGCIGVGIVLHLVGMVVS